MNQSEIPTRLIELIEDARTGGFTDERIETFWGVELIFRDTDDGRLKVWEWYGDSETDIERSFLTTFTLEGYSDAEVARFIKSEYSWPS